MRFSLAIRFVTASFFLTVLSAPHAFAETDWPGWGGPNRDFITEGAAIADKWPAAGPRQLWKLDVAGGYAAIPVADGVAYVFARDKDEEVVLALDAKSGEKKWEYRYASPIPKNNKDETGEYDTRFGWGPNAMPYVLKDRVVTIGYFSQMHCLDKNGKLLWQHDLKKDYPGTFLFFGYSASPILYKNALITLVGGKEHALVAFDPADGKVLWHKHDDAVSYSSPQIRQVGGRDVLITQVLNKVLVCNPDTGDLLWSAPREYQYSHNAAHPVLCAGDTLFVGTPGKDGGSVAYKLKWEGESLSGEKIWTSKFAQVHQNAIAVGDQILSSRDRPKGILALEKDTGDFAWQEREIGQCNFVKAGDKIVSLSEDGTLRVCKMKDEGLEVLAEADLLGDRSWAPPTVVGTRVYIRDTKQAMALDLAAPATAGR